MAPPNATKAQRNKRRKRPPHPGEAERIATRRAKVMELRKQGLSFRAIAAQVRSDCGTVCRDVAAEMAELKTLTHQAAEDARAIELARLDRLWHMLERHGLKHGDHRAVIAAVRISDRRAKLLGLDAPTKLAGHDGGPIQPAVLYIPDNHRKATTA